MAVSWPDGSLTGSVRVEESAPVPVAEPEPVTETEKPTTEPVSEKKEVAHGDR